MGTDIWIHIEYKSRKPNKYIHADFKPDKKRVYSLFGALAGASGDIAPIYEPRGLPDDITQKTWKEHKDGEGDFHTESWLTSQELRECIDLVIKEWTSKDDTTIEETKDVLSSYERIYNYMKDSDDEEEPSRIVFWFDN